MNYVFAVRFLALVCSVFVASAGYFAVRQAIWVDETTQLSGLSLPFVEQLLWLIGRSDVQFGVPDDRMPPLSYWLGGLWSAVFGLGETSLRWFGIMATLAAAPALYLAGRERGGAAGGVFAVAVILLSPNTVVIAGEIRAYPLFLAFAAWSVWAFLRCIDPDAGDRPGRLAALALVLILTAYTHFFGVVLAGVLLGTLLVDRLVSRTGIRAVLITGAGTGVAMLGLVPFIVAAIGVSGDGAAAQGASFRDVVVGGARLVYRLFLHGSHGVYLAILVGTALALLGLAALALWPSSRRDEGKLSQARQSALVLLPLALAGLTLPILDLLIGSFAVLAPHYNLWMGPLAGVFLAGAFAADPRRAWLDRGAKVFGCLAIAGHLAANTLLLSNATLYGHGPGEWLAEQWEQAGQPAIVHDADGAWGHSYFPVHFLSRGEAVQFLLHADGSLERILPGGVVRVDDPPTHLEAFENILLVRTRNMSSGELARIIRGEQPCALQPPRGGSPANVEYLCAYGAAAVTLMPKLRPSSP